MKHIFSKFISYILFPAVIAAGNSVYALNRYDNVRHAGKKYLIVLFVLLIFFVILYLGLSVYNKFFVSDVLKTRNLDDISLKTPSDNEDAIKRFIYRNRLK